MVAKDQEIAKKLFSNIRDSMMVNDVDELHDIHSIKSKKESLKLLKNIEKWRSALVSEKLVTFKTVLDLLNQKNSEWSVEWEFKGIFKTEYQCQILTDCSVCNAYDRVKRYGCESCHNKSLNISISADSSLLSVKCNKCEHFYEVVVNKPSSVMPAEAAGLPPMASFHYEAHELSYKGICVECLGNSRYYRPVLLNIELGVFKHLPTDIVFHLIPGNKNIDHKAQCHSHDNGISHFCHYPEAQCCCNIGEAQAPFLVAKTPVTWKQACKNTPNILGFGKFNGFGGRKYESAIEENYPVTCITKKQASEWLQNYELRLPTPKEWAYAAKGGAPTAYPWGDDKDGLNNPFIYSFENSIFVNQEVVPNYSMKNAHVPDFMAQPSATKHTTLEKNKKNFGNSVGSIPEEYLKLLNNEAKAFDHLYKNRGIQNRLRALANTNMFYNGDEASIKEYLEEILSDINTENEADADRDIATEELANATLESDPPQYFLDVHPVARNKRYCNGFGLSDMLGNVWEFVDGHVYSFEGVNDVVAGGSSLLSKSDFPGPRTSFCAKASAPHAIDIGFRPIKALDI